jgi:hypothetical protein
MKLLIRLDRSVILWEETDHDKVECAVCGKTIKVEANNGITSKEIDKHIFCSGVK